MAWTDFFWVGAALLVMLYLYLTTNYDFFDQKRLLYRRPYPLLGNMAPAFFRRMSLAQLTQSLYEQFKHAGVGGLFDYGRPVLLACDPELVRWICVKEFDSFADRSAPGGEGGDELLARSLPELTGQRWRAVRAAVEPAFADGSVRGLFEAVSQCARRAADQLQERLRAAGAADSKAPLTVELKDLFSRVSSEIIAAAAFGARGDSPSEFLLRGREVADFSGRSSAVALGHTLVPGLRQALGLQSLQAATKRFFRSLVREAASRQQGSEEPGAELGAGQAAGADVLQQLLRLRPDPVKEPQPAAEPAGQPVELTDDDITAQMLLFFLGGLDTVSTLLSFLTSLLVFNPDAEQKVQAELQKVLEESDYELTYDGIQKLKYLDMAISETLRLYPPSPISERKCTKTFVMKNSERCSGFVLRPGDAVWVPIYAIHHDPDFFSDPDKFMPERFSDENKQNIKPFTYIPFGAGPRGCIGMQFAVMQVKIIVAHFLARYEFKCTEKTPMKIELSKKTSQMTVDGGFLFEVEEKKKKRESCGPKPE